MFLSPIITPVSFPVTPVKTGAQGHKQDLASGKTMKPAMYCMVPWFPASAGITEKRRG